MNDILYSIDNEYYYEYDRFQDNLLNDYEIGEVLVAYEASKDKVKLRLTYPLDSMIDDLFDQGEELADDYIDKISLISSDDRNELNDMIVNWVISKVGEPEFFLVKDVKEILVTVGE